MWPLGCVDAVHDHQFHSGASAHPYFYVGALFTLGRRRMQRAEVRGHHVGLSLEGYGFAFRNGAVGGSRPLLRQPSPRFLSAVTPPPVKNCLTQIAPSSGASGGMNARTGGWRRSGRARPSRSNPAGAGCARAYASGRAGGDQYPAVMVGRLSRGHGACARDDSTGTGDAPAAGCGAGPTAEDATRDKGEPAT